jgi:antitoxin HigA-1
LLCQVGVELLARESFQVILRADALPGVTLPGLSELLNAKRGISPEMAVRLSKAFGDTEECWLARQTQYDLANVRHRIKVKRLSLG